MALIDVTKESLTEVLKREKDLNLSGIWDADKLADFILNYYTSVVPVSSFFTGSAAFMIKDVISGELVPMFSPFNSEKKCRELKQKFFPTAQYKVVKLYEVVE